jgi:hypothetical protein
MKKKSKQGKELHPGYFSMDQISQDKLKKKKNLKFVLEKDFVYF